jgi:hypothetical protein
MCLTTNWIQESWDTNLIAGNIKGIVKFLNEARRL